MVPLPGGRTPRRPGRLKLKAMGVQRGWPDFVLFDPTGRLHALELKRQGETLSDGQEAFQEWAIATVSPTR